MQRNSLAGNKNYGDQFYLQRQNRKLKSPQDKDLFIRKINKRISHLGDAKKLGEALQCFRVLIDSKLPPTVVTYTALLNAFVRCNEPFKALEIFQSLTASTGTSKQKWYFPKRPISPNIITYTTIIKGLCNSFMLKQAGNIFLPLVEKYLSVFKTTQCSSACDQPLDKEMLPLTDAIGTNAFLNVRCVNTFLRGCVKCGDLLTAWSVFVALQEVYSLIDSFSIGSVINLLSHAQLLDEAIQILETYECRKQSEVNVATPSLGAEPFLDIALAYTLRQDLRLGRKYLKQAKKHNMNEPVSSTFCDATGNASQKQFSSHKNSELKRRIEELETYLDTMKRKDRALCSESNNLSLIKFYKKLFLFPSADSRISATYIDNSNLIPSLVIETLADNDSNIDETNACSENDNIPNQSRNILIDSLRKCSFTDNQEDVLIPYYFHLFTMGLHVTVQNHPKPLKKLKSLFKNELSSSGHINVQENKVNKMEVCSGAGDWVLAQAKKDTNVEWFALELRYDRVYQIFSQSILLGCNSITTVGGDAKQILSRYFPSLLFDEVYINFPEPPPYPDHPNHLLNAEFFKILHPLLKNNASVYIVSDKLQYLMSLTVILLGLSQLYKLHTAHKHNNNHSSTRPCSAPSIFNGLPPCFGVAGDSSYFDRFWANGDHNFRGYLLFKPL